MRRADDVDDAAPLATENRRNLLAALACVVYHGHQMSPKDTKDSSSSAALQKEFLEQLGARLKVGETEYGDKSFHVPGTAEEILVELLDVAGWSFVAWVQMRIRLQGLELAARKLDVEPAVKPGAVQVHALTSMRSTHMAPPPEPAEREMDGRYSDAQRRRPCTRCGGAGWVHAGELEEPPDNWMLDDTHYTCPECQGDATLP